MSVAPVSPDLDHLLSIAEAQRALGIGRTTLYRLIREGELPVAKIGRRTLISARRVQIFVEALLDRHGSNEEGDYGND